MKVLPKNRTAWCKALFASEPDNEIWKHANTWSFDKLDEILGSSCEVQGIKKKIKDVVYREQHDAKMKEMKELSKRFMFRD